MLALLALVAAQAAAALPAETRTFRDWTVGCDNVRGCEAIALFPENGWDGWVTMSFRRDGARDAAPVIYLSLENIPAALFADGRPIAARFHEELDGVRIEARDPHAASPAGWPVYSRAGMALAFPGAHTALLVRPEDFGQIAAGRRVAGPLLVRH